METAQRFVGRTAIVTGAGSGLGRAVAARIAAEGGAVACLDLAADAVQETARAVGGGARAYPADVSDPASVKAAVEGAARELGRPSVVVTCAGVGKFAHAAEMSFEDWSRIIAVNLTGTFLVVQAALPHLLDGGGSITTIASNAGLQGVPYGAAYCASKGGVVQLTRSLAAEFLARGVRANCVAPGGIKTPLQRAFELPPGGDPEHLRRLMTPLGRSKPEEVAALVAFIASDEGRYMSGAIVPFDGGLTI
ncbi:MAG: SDR family oxidoreductase [Deltaproteobacteria bacterium]|nr:SDR family oxidoreductase [Deltaproteobacteria bacterium]